MARRAMIVVEFHADPELSLAQAGEMLSEVVDAVNQIGYVSEAQWLMPRESED